ncbi:MAG: hypothetical protein WBR29_05365 [Gammaproteobacteria bacterium]
MQKVIALIIIALASKVAIAADPSPLEVLKTEVGSSVDNINHQGHPIFLSSCRTTNNKIITLVIASNGVDGFQIELKHGIITSLAEITPAPKKNTFLVDADGGVYSQRMAENILSVMKKQPFHLVENLTLDDLTNPGHPYHCVVRDIN